jgi:hypothetical protein
VTLLRVRLTTGTYRPSYTHAHTQVEHLHTTLTPIYTLLLVLVPDVVGPLKIGAIDSERDWNMKALGGGWVY